MSSFTYTWENHFQLEDGERGLRVTFGRSARRPGTFREECAEAATRIARSTSEPIRVCLSGGIDAEIACRAFIDAGIRVHPVMLTWKHGLNRQDVEIARRFCRAFDLKLDEREVDVVEFFAGGFWKYCEKLALPMWAAVWKDWIADQIDGFLVMGNGWITTYYDESERRVRLREDSHARNPFARPSVPDFFRYHPELMLAILTDSDIERWCRVCQTPLEKLGEVLTFKFFALSKYYERDRFPLEFRHKRTGVESILPLAKEAIARSNERYGQRVRGMSWDYQEMIARLGGDT